MGDPMRVGLIGTGKMGSAMGRSLARRGAFAIVLFNRTREKADRLAAEIGATVASTSAELARSCDVVITMLADGAALLATYGDTDGVLAGLRAGTICVDMGTSGRPAALAVAGRVTAAGSRFVDAPVSGVPAVAEAGELLILAGGAAEDIDGIRPVLAALGRRVIEVGPVGSGAAMKLALNAALHGLNQAVAEALVLAERAGIDRAVAYDVFASGALSGPFVLGRRPVFLAPRIGAQPFSLHLMAKDLRLAQELARAVGSPMPQSALNLQVAEAAIAAGFGELDESAVAVYLRERS